MSCAKVVILVHLRNSSLFGPHAAATAPNARADISYHGRDSCALVLVHGGLWLSTDTNPGVIGHAISACFTRFSVEREALRSFLLTHSSRQKWNDNKTRKEVRTFCRGRACSLQMRYVRIRCYNVTYHDMYHTIT